MAEKTLIELEQYLKTGSHIGTKFKTGDMQRYIFKQRKDGLRVLDVATIDKRIKIAADFISKFPPEKTVAISRKVYGRGAVNAFAVLTGSRALTGRFVPGTFTNPNAKEFIEPSIVIITDPDADRQAINETIKIKIPVIALCSTSNYLRNIDLVIPVNNKGRKSLALVYWLLAREILRNRGMLKNPEDFETHLPDFEYKLKEGAEEEPEEGNLLRGADMGRMRRAKRFDKRPRGRKRI